jgi:hypothetical protein
MESESIVTGQPGRGLTDRAYFAFEGGTNFAAPAMPRILDLSQEGD